MTSSRTRSRFARLAARSLAAVALASTALLAPARAEAGGLLGGLLGGSKTAPKEVVLHLQSGAATGSVLSVVSALGWKVVWQAAPSNLWVLQPSGLFAASLDVVRGVLATLPGVRAVEENVFFTLDDPYGGKQSQAPMFSDDLTFASVGSQPAMATIGAVEVPPGPPPSPVVAVVDGGFDLGHEALPASSVAWAHDAVDGDADPTDLGNGLDDDGDGRVDAGRGHGTAVAALVLAVSPSARVAPVRALDDEGDGSTATLAAAIDRATAPGVSVIHLSLGAAQPSAIVEHFLGVARQQGIVVVAAAGNGNGGPVCYPATSPNVIAVAGARTDGTGDPASSRGPQVDASAPSVDVVAPHPRAPDAYGYWQGTSFSAPLFSGAIAQCVVGRPGTVAQAEADALLGALTPFPPPGSPGHGAGVLHVERALRR